MIDFTGYRPFSFAALPRGDRIDTAPQLIDACQIKHLGYLRGPLGNAGSLALAKWIIANRAYIDQPKPGTHPLNSGTAIERVLAGDILPEEAFAVDLAEATAGMVLPEMFGQPATQSLSSALAAALDGAGAGADEEEPVAGSVATPVTGRRPVPLPVQPAHPAESANVVLLADGLPALGALGGALPPGRLFHPIADPRFPQGFVLTGCGVMLCLDESTAQAMITALEAGAAHLRRMRAPRDARGAAA